MNGNKQISEEKSTFNQWLELNLNIKYSLHFRGLHFPSLMTFSNSPKANKQACFTCIPEVGGGGGDCEILLKTTFWVFFQSIQEEIGVSGCLHCSCDSAHYGE